MGRTVVVRARVPTPAEIAWIALVPCALALLAAIALLGPPLAHVLFRPDGDALWPPGWWEARGNPEPVKHARYLLAALAPLPLVAAVLVGARRAPALPPQAIRAVVLGSQALLLALLALAVLGQHDVVPLGGPQAPQLALFGVGTLVVAAGLVAAALLALRRERVAAWAAGLARETTRRRVVAAVLAAAFATAWLLQAVTTDRLVEDQGQFNWTLNDAFAVLDGRTPLVDYHLLYGKLVPYPAALAMKAFGTTGFVYTAFLALLSLLALLAVYALLRRVAGSSLLALGLFLPFLALTGMRATMTQAGTWPMRYGGAYVLAWLTVRQLDGRSPRRPWVLAFVGALVAVNSMEFGLGALLGSVAALLCAQPPRSVRVAARLGGELAAGAVGALALVCAFTLARAGALPDLDLLTEWPRIFTSLGWFSLPVPSFGLHLAVYATFVGATALAAVRLARGADEPLLTSMLMWSGVFGLVAGSYYVGRAEDLKLLAMFSAWAFALALLTIACVRALAARAWRAPTLAQLLVLFGFALAVCTVVQMPAPWKQVERLTRATPALRYRPAAERFVRERTSPGEKVAILFPEAHRIAYDLGLDNVSPFGIQNAVVTVSQMRALIDTLRREQVNAVFVPSPSQLLLIEGNSAPEQLQLLEREGWPIVAEQDPGFVELRRER
jgi:hypothetical protein